jgi:hypothetical protein
MGEPAMPKWTFVGRIHPERSYATIENPKEATIHYPAIGLKAKTRTIIHSGQAVVDLDITEGNADIFTLRNVAVDCVYVLTDLVGYLKGLSLQVEMLWAIQQETGDWRLFGIDVPVLVARRKDRDQKLTKADLEAVGSSVPLQMALADFREAMRSPAGTGFFCYRAIEAMMQSMKNTPEKESATWERFRNALRVDASAIFYVKGHADFARHGKAAAASDAERGRVFEITDEIISRFMEHLRSGVEQLDASKFPTLA